MIAPPPAGPGVPYAAPSQFKTHTNPVAHASS